MEVPFRGRNRFEHTLTKTGGSGKGFIELARHVSSLLPTLSMIQL